MKHPNGDPSYRATFQRLFDEHQKHPDDEVTNSPKRITVTLSPAMAEVIESAAKDNDVSQAAIVFDLVAEGLSKKMAGWMRHKAMDLAVEAVREATIEAALDGAPVH